MTASPSSRSDPALTFALREALYGLDRIAARARPGARRPLARSADGAPDARRTGPLAAHYRGTPDEQRLLRHFSYSDRIRYYWPAPEARAAVADLIAELDAEPIAETLVSQFLPRSYAAVRDRAIPAQANALIAAAIRAALDPYTAATGAN